MRKLFAVLILFSAVIACNVKQEKKNEVSEDPEKLMNINKAMIAEEQELIDNYIQRFNYKMTATETGLQYQHIVRGNGRQPQFNDDVTLAYRMKLLDGTYCYSSDSSGLLTFRLGQSTEPGGIQEGVLMMKEGGKSMLIVPSWLAYGITGDGDRIGSNQTLVCEVELVAVKDN
jgi:FKBP-type peptidyl-prolyl cis-trans isomerase FkpA